MGITKHIPNSIIDDGIVFVTAGVFRVFDDPCDTSFIPRICLLRIRYLLACQLLGNLLERRTIDVRLEDVADNISFIMLDNRVAISHGVAVWDKACLFHGISPTAVL